jgi:hypothetical protein
MALREYARFVADAVLCRRVERAKTRVRELSAFITVHATFQLVWGSVSLEFDLPSKDRPCEWPAATRQRSGFGNQSYNSGEPNTGTSYGSGVDGPRAKQRSNGGR